MLSNIRVATVYFLFTCPDEFFICVFIYSINTILLHYYIFLLKIMISLPSV